MLKIFIPKWFVTQMIIQKNYIRKFYGIFSNNGGIKVVVIFVRLQFEQCLKLILKTSNNTVTYFRYRLIDSYITIFLGPALASPTM